MHCPNCGNNLEQNARFCGRCGTPIYQEKTALQHNLGGGSPYIEKKHTEKKEAILRGSLIAGLLMLALCIGITAAWLIAGGRKSAVSGPEQIYYDTIRGRMSWNEAKRQAGEKGGSLVRIDSQAQFDELTDTLEGEEDRAYILGAHRDAGDRNYYWDDDDRASAVPLNSEDAWCADLWTDGSDLGDVDKEGYILMYYDPDGECWRWTAIQDPSEQDEVYLIQLNNPPADDRNRLDTDSDMQTLSENDQPDVEPEPAEPDPVNPAPANPNAVDPGPNPNTPNSDASNLLSDSGTRKTVNEFMSNFSEVPFTDFSRGGNNDRSQLVMFSLLHYLANYSFGRDRLDSATLDGRSCTTISTANVDECLTRFLGVQIAHDSFDWYGVPVTFKDGVYYYPASDDDRHNTLSIVTEMKRDAGAYSVKFDVYELDSSQSGVDGKYYAMTADEAKACGELTRRGSGTAVIEDYNYNGKVTYRLISYTDPIHAVPKQTLSEKQETESPAAVEAPDGPAEPEQPGDSDDADGQGPAEQTLSESNYIIVQSNVSWDEAMSEARANGGKLVTFDTEEEYQLVRNMLGNYKDVTFMLGARRDGGTEYRWVDGSNQCYGGAINGSGAWSAGDPSFEYDGREETVVMMSYDPAEGRWVWIDASATYLNPDRYYGYIIELNH